MQYTTLLRMIIFVMLMYDFGRDTVPYRKTLLATNKDPCVEARVVSLEGKAAVQFPQIIFWSVPAHTDMGWGSGLLWK